MVPPGSTIIRNPGSIVRVTPEFIVQVSPSSIVASKLIVVSEANVIEAA